MTVVLCRCWAAWLYVLGFLSSLTTTNVNVLPWWSIASLFLVVENCDCQPTSWWMDRDWRLGTNREHGLLTCPTGAPAQRAATVVHHNDSLYIETHDRPALLASPPGQLLVTSDAIKDLVYNRFALFRSKMDYPLVHLVQRKAFYLQLCIILTPYIYSWRPSIWIWG